MVKRSILGIKVAREIKSNWKQYLSVILIAALAVTLFTGIWANYRSFQDKLNTIYQESNMCDGIVMVKNHDEEIEKYLQSKGYEYQKRLYYPTRVDNTSIYLATFKESDKLNLPYKVNIENGVKKEVLVDRNFLTKTKLKVGDLIKFSISFEAYDIDISLPISGTMNHPESLENATYNASFVYVNQEALIEEIVNSLAPEIKNLITTIFKTTPEEYITEKLESSYNQYLIKSGNIGNLLSTIKLNYKDNDNFVYALKTSELPSNITIEADVLQAKKLLYIFPVIFYLVAILIILTSISQLINREQKNIGILKALGYSKSEIIWHYTNIFIVLGLIGSVIGIILGPTIIPNVMAMKYNILYQLPKIKTHFFRFEYLLSMLILLIIIVSTSLIACHDSVRKVPAESLRGDNAVKMKLSFLSKISFFKKMPLSILMAFRNMKRKFSRTLMVILGVLGCTALLACGFGIEDTINHGLDLELEDYIPYDISATYSANQSFEDTISKIDHVKYVDEYAKYSVNLTGKNVISSYVYLLPEKSFIFKPNYNNDDCLISSKVAKKLGCSSGDAITFIYDGKQYTVTITKVVDFCISQGIFISKNYFENQEQKLSFKPTGCWVMTDDTTYNEEISNQIKDIDGIISSMSMAQTREHANNTIASIKVMTLTVKVFAILLAIVVLYNLALLNFKERIKDIATLKVLGFSKLEIGSSFIIEIITLTFVGSLIGLLFGKPLLIAVLSINENPLLSYVYYIKPISYILTVLLTCGTSLCINLFFAGLTRKVQMVESLKSVE